MNLVYLSQSLLDTGERGGWQGVKPSVCFAASEDILFIVSVNKWVPWSLMYSYFIQFFVILFVFLIHVIIYEFVTPNHFIYLNKTYVWNCSVFRLSLPTTSLCPVAYITTIILIMLRFNCIILVAILAYVNSQSIYMFWLCNFIFLQYHLQLSIVFIFSATTEKKS